MQKSIEALFEQASNAQINDICHVIINNRTPPEYGINIGGACRFTYQDGQTHDDFHDRTDIPSGSSLNFRSNNGCVKTIRVVIVARSAQHGEATYVYEEPPLPADRCLRLRELTLGPRDDTSAQITLQDLLELKKA